MYVHIHTYLVGEWNKVPTSGLQAFHYIYISTQLVDGTSSSSCSDKLYIYTDLMDGTKLQHTVIQTLHTHTHTHTNIYMCVSYIYIKYTHIYTFIHILDGWKKQCYNILSHKVYIYAHIHIADGWKKQCSNNFIISPMS